MKRRIIGIHQEKCNGCGLCVEACHEGAIALVDGVAKLMRDDYCDGLGDCLPNCPTGAISFVEKETVPYDAEAVKRHMEKRHNNGDCPGARARSVQTEQTDAPAVSVRSRLQNWPVQIKLAAPNAPYFQGCDLLIAADCTAYACAGFHERFIQNRVTVIGCPKLDNIDYSVKLAAILPAQRHSLDNGCAHGGAVLRRSDCYGQKSSRRQRKKYSAPHTGSFY